jgi:hypothetical protein
MLYALYPRIARILRILMLLHSPSAGQLMRCNQIHEGMMVRMIQGSSSMDIDKRKQYDNACRSYCKEETGAKHSNEYCIEADSIEKVRCTLDALTERYTNELMLYDFMTRVHLKTALLIHLPQQPEHPCRRQP